MAVEITVLNPTGDILRIDSKAGYDMINERFGEGPLLIDWGRLSHIYGGIAIPNVEVDGSAIEKMQGRDCTWIILWMAYVVWNTRDAFEDFHAFPL